MSTSTVKGDTETTTTMASTADTKQLRALLTAADS
jgi:hypothetical protein